MNNYERIKNNNIEQMADLLFAFTFYEEEEIGEDNTKILNWLKDETECPYKQLKRKEKECEELKKYQYKQEYLDKEIEKYHQALQEIKELLETTCWDYTDITVTKVKDDILQIISEVE